MLYMGMECVRGWNVRRIVTSKNLAKLKQYYYYFHAEFLEEVRYTYMYAYKQLHYHRLRGISYVIIFAATCIYIHVHM